MTIIEELNEIIQLHDAYAAVRYDEHKPVGLIDQFHEWHGKASTLFSRHLSANDTELLKFKNIKHGNCYVLASQFGEIETYFHILVDRLRNSVPAKLEQYIEEGETIAATIKYIEAPSGVIRLYNDYAIGNEKDYQEWKNKCQRILKLHYEKEGSYGRFMDAEASFKDNNYDPVYIQDMIGVLKACVEIPSITEEFKEENPSPVSPVTINVNQTQSQSQNVAVDVFLESIKDEIPGRHFKELKAIAAEENDPVKAKSKILDKVKSFGEDVLSNIVANIITNPAVWLGLL